MKRNVLESSGLFSGCKLVYNRMENSGLPKKMDFRFKTEERTFRIKTAES